MKRLALSDIGLQVDCIGILCGYIRGACVLVDLDLSRLHLPTRVYLSIIEAICYAPRLHYINISGNQIINTHQNRYKNIPVP